MSMPLSVEQNITLELLDEKHAEGLLQLVKRNKVLLAQWLPWVGKMSTIKDFENFILHAQKRCSEGLDLPYVIMVDRTLAGRIGLYEIDHTNKFASIGYWLAEEFQGSGVVTRSCKEIITYGFTTLHLNRIEIKCGTENYKSQAIAERLHFTKEGVLREAEFINGKFIDLYLYSMLRHEWRND
jgi:ribosomal-protein-serine acetyltransferase